MRKRRATPVRQLRGWLPLGHCGRHRPLKAPRCPGRVEARSEGSLRKMTRSISPEATFAPICWSPPYGPDNIRLTASPVFSFYELSSGSRCIYLVISEEVLVCKCKRHHFSLFVVMSYQSQVQLLVHVSSPIRLIVQTVLIISTKTCVRSSLTFKPNDDKA